MTEKRKEKTPLSDLSSSDPKRSERDSSFLRESHGMTLDRPFGSEEKVENLNLQSNIEFHLTILLKVHLSNRQLSLLLDVLNYQAVRFGINFTMLMAMWELYFRLLGDKKSASYVNDGRIKVTLTVTEILLRTLRDELISLSPGDYFHIPDSVKKLLKPGLMSHRTYGSRFRSWRPEKYLQVRIVPVEVQFLDRSKDSQPYSSYCKGYGESHPSALRQKTRISSELDVDETKIELEEECKLLVQSVHPLHLLSEFLISEYELVKREK